MGLALRNHTALRAGQSRWDSTTPPEPSRDELLYETILDRIDQRDVETIQAYAEFVAADIDSDLLRDLLFGVLIHSDQRWITRMSRICCDPLSEPLTAMRLEADRRMAEFIETHICQLSAGETPVRRNDFITRCVDELQGENYEIFVVQNLNKTESTELRMTRDQCMLVAMRESKAVRRKVLDKLKDMEAQPKPPAELSRLEILQLAIDSEQGRIKAEAERDEAIRTKAQIGSRREAKAMAKASHAARQVTPLRQPGAVHLWLRRADRQG